MPGHPEGPTGPSSGGRLIEWARERGYDHPRLKLAAREGWGAVRAAARSLHLPTPFDPPELSDLRALDGSVGAPPVDGPTVLVLSFRGWSTHVVIENLVASALRARGAAPVVLTCGGRLPLCDVVPAPFAPPTPCLSCAGYVQDALEATGLRHVDLGDLVDVRRAGRAATTRVQELTTIDECRSFTAAGLHVGELVRTSVAWALSAGTIDSGDRLALPTYRRFLASAVVLAEAFERALDTVRPERVFLLNGAFFAERVLVELCTRRDVPVVRYERGFLPSTVVVSRWSPEADELDPGEAAWEEAARQPLTDQEEQRIGRYLQGRVHGSKIINAFWQGAAPDPASVREELGLGAGQPLVSAFCNILWDSAILGKDRAFPSMTEWVRQAIGWAGANPGVHVVVRVHPAEVKLRNHPTREPVMAHVQRMFPQLPANVTVVGPRDPLNSYAIAAASDIGLVYSSTIGLEMACAGTPVVVGARVHYAGRGFTRDPEDSHQYWATVDGLLRDPPDSTDQQRRRELARRYAHLFFFRFHQTIETIEEPGQSRVRLRPTAAAAVGGGVDPGLDRLVDAVLHLDGSLVAPRQP